MYMKKIAFMCGITALLTGCAVLKSPPAQVPEVTNFSRLYVWEKPMTEYAQFKDFLPDSATRVVAAVKTDGKSAYLMTSGPLYRSILQHFDTTRVPPGLYLGLDFNTDFFSNFSLLTDDQIRKIADANKRKAAEAFNQREKFTVVSVGPNPVWGKKDDDGVIRPLTNKELQQLFSQQTVPIQSQQKTLKRGVAGAANN